MGLAKFGIHQLNIGGGVLALSPIPAGAGLYVLRDWRPDLVVSMTTSAELQAAGLTGFADVLRDWGITWLHLPVMDFGTPVDMDWPQVHVQVLPVLQCGGRILIHCKGGCGRSGMMILRLMIAAGQAPETALVNLRAVRPCAVETDAQLDWAMQG